MEKQVHTQMRRSKLETHIDILKVLAHSGPLKPTHIMNKANLNGGKLNEYLSFLIKQGLVEERTLKKGSSVFAVTQRGIIVLKQLREISQVLHVVEEAQR